jgi:hypothetical protein
VRVIHLTQHINMSSRVVCDGGDGNASLWPVRLAPVLACCVGKGMAIESAISTSQASYSSRSRTIRARGHAVDMAMTMLRDGHSERAPLWHKHFRIITLSTSAMSSMSTSCACSTSSQKLTGAVPNKCVGGRGGDDDKEMRSLRMPITVFKPRRNNRQTGSASSPASRVYASYGFSWGAMTHQHHLHMASDAPLRPFV